MRRLALILSLACAAIAPSAHAKTVWLGGQIAIPAPGRDVGRDQLGAGAGATIHFEPSPYVGLGFDVVHHYFPASAGYKAGMNRYLYLRRLAAIDGPTYAFTAIQVTPHVRVNAPLGRRWAVWVQGGAGNYYVDRNLTAPDLTGSYAYVTGPWFKKYIAVEGWNAGLGVDMHPGSSLTVGFEAAHHQISSSTETGIWGSEAIVPEFNAITVGMHVLYGW